MAKSGCEINIEKMTGKTISKIWLSSTNLFDLAQLLLNGNFWSEFLVRFKPFTGGDIVDLACGTGEFRKHISPKSYLGIDLNHKFIFRARKNINFPKTEFEVENILKRKINNNPDTVFFISAAHHLSDKEIGTLGLLMKTSQVKRFILVDGRPIGPLSGILSFLDAKLGGGKYFRGPEQLAALIKPHLKIIESGEFSAFASFYTYPYLLATAIRP